MGHILARISVHVKNNRKLAYSHKYQRKFLTRTEKCDLYGDMKKIVTVERIQYCDKCPYVRGGGVAGWYGNEVVGGYVAYCKKRYNKKLCDCTYDNRWDNKKAEAKFKKELSKIPEWCPLEDY